MRDKCEAMAFTSHIIQHDADPNLPGCTAYHASHPKKIFNSEITDPTRTEQFMTVQCEDNTSRCFFHKSHLDDTKCKETCPSTVFSDACTNIVDQCPSQHNKEIDEVYDPYKMNTHDFAFSDNHLDESYSRLAIGVPVFDEIVGAITELGKGACCARYHVNPEGQAISGSGSPGCDSAVIDSVCGQVVAHNNPFIHWGGAQCPHKKYYDSEFFLGRNTSTDDDGKEYFMNSCKDCIESVQISCAPHHSWDPNVVPGGKCVPGGVCDSVSTACGFQNHENRAVDLTECVGPTSEAQCNAATYHTQQFCNWLPTWLLPTSDNFGKVFDGTYACYGTPGSNCDQVTHGCSDTDRFCHACGDGKTVGEGYISLKNCRWNGVSVNSIPIKCSIGATTTEFPGVLLNCGQVPPAPALPSTSANKAKIPCDLFICEWDTLQWTVGVAALVGCIGMAYLIFLYFFGRPGKNVAHHGYLLST
tara:strand:- start:4399 stop:5817 length:1419 start_codon:yes stop_codon:yes gene_type:complete